MNSTSSFDDEYSDEQFLSISRNSNNTVKPRPKFTILDDLDELN